jgi:hypothetical protein
LWFSRAAPKGTSSFFRREHAFSLRHVFSVRPEKEYFSFSSRYLFLNISRPGLFFKRGNAGFFPAELSRSGGEKGMGGIDSPPPA